MNRKEFIEKLEEFGFPKEDFVILSGGSLLMRGLREETADFDLSVSEELAESLDLANCPRDDKGCFVPFENVQMTAGMEDRQYDVVDGYRCESLESVLALKKKLRRPKDLKDIAVREEWLASRQDDLYSFMIKRGYPEEFAKLVSLHMHTDYQAKRMRGYISGMGHPSPEDIADEMMTILGDIERFKQKHIAERAQAKVNDFYRNWNED